MPCYSKGDKLATEVVFGSHASCVCSHRIRRCPAWMFCRCCAADDQAEARAWAGGVTRAEGPLEKAPGKNSSCLILCGSTRSPNLAEKTKHVAWLCWRFLDESRTFLRGVLYTYVPCLVRILRCMVFLSLSTCARNVSRVGPCGDDIYGRQRACFDICVCVSSFPSELWGLIHREVSVPILPQGRHGSLVGVSWWSRVSVSRW